MLRGAANPVRSEQISIPKINLRLGNVYLMDFPAGSFDFIYSLGMFGHGCPVTIDLLNKFHEWLRPGGKLLFNTVDSAGLPLLYRARRQAREWVYPMLSKQMQKRLDDRHAKSPFFEMSKSKLEKTLTQTNFKSFQVASHVCQSPLWNGRHLECLASR
jgi:cyclopropane fatty-acyl-phospholipid synthase-like methyltransferase